jgi:uncharacterized protein (DUF58 family)
VIPKEILKKVRQIQIRTDRLVNDVLAGEYQSAFKGRGMEFAEVRTYVPGDDVRSIDWNVTARTGIPHVKNFVEERELTVVLLVDMSLSGEFGSVTQTKLAVATELCAVLAFSAIKSSDKVGLILFTDRIEKFIPPKKGRTHVLRVIRELLTFKPERTKTDIALALDYLSKVIRRKSVVFLVSDFLAGGWEKPLSIANRRHDVTAVTVTDPREVEMPDIGLVLLEDAETGETLLVDTGSKRVRQEFQARSIGTARALATSFRRRKVDELSIRTDRSFAQPLMEYFLRKGGNR